ncbi:MAG: hypothetical protein R2813_03155 [Flavobacteriales bacterium]
MGNRVKSQLDPLKTDVVEGWAFNIDYPEDKMLLDLYINEQLVSSQRTSVYRKGLFERRLHPSGVCGFKFVLPKQILEGDQVSVRVSASNEDISGSPTVMKRPEVQFSPRRIFFMHIAKTGGTTINEWMGSYYGEERIRPHIEGSRLFSEPELLEQYDFVSGHVRVQRFEQLAGANELLKTTLLRDPIEHLASHLAWVKRVGEDPTSRFFKSHSEEVKQLALEVQKVDFSQPEKLGEFLNNASSEALNLFDNCQLRYFLSEQLFGRVRIDHLVEAMSVMSRLNLVGCVERMTDFMQDLGALAGIPIKAVGATRNKHGERYGLNLNDAKTLRIMLPFVIYDLMLYQTVKEDNLKNVGTARV